MFNKRQSFIKNSKNVNVFRKRINWWDKINLFKNLNFIISKGYDGPVSVEPFNENLNKMEVNEKLQRVWASLLRFSIWLEFYNKTIFQVYSEQSVEIKIPV